MKKILWLAILLPTIVFGQKTERKIDNSIRADNFYTPNDTVATKAEVRAVSGSTINLNRGLSLVNDSVGLGGNCNSDATINMGVNKGFRINSDPIGGYSFFRMFNDELYYIGYKPGNNYYNSFDINSSSGAISMESGIDGGENSQLFLNKNGLFYGNHKTNSSSIWVTDKQYVDSVNVFPTLLELNDDGTHDTILHVLGSSGATKIGLFRSTGSGTALTAISNLGIPLICESEGTVNIAKFFNGSDSVIIKTNGNIETTGQIKAFQISAALTDGIPTDSEIDTATGLTPATAGSGYQVTIKDNNGTGLLYKIESDGTGWYYTVMTLAL